jgi:hypothetical protein
MTYATRFRTRFASFAIGPRATRINAPRFLSWPGVLERMNKDGRLARSVPTDDARTLFKIANKSAIRHDNPAQMREFGASFREWIFHSFLAAIRLATLVVEEDSEKAG